MGDASGGFFSPTEVPKHLTFEGGEAGVRLLAELNFKVPPRGPLRRNWRREAYCTLQLIRTLLVVRPDVFPARLTRTPHSSSPDFILAPIRSEGLFAIEHTDVAEPGMLDWLDALARDVVHTASSFNEAGYTGDAERIFRDALMDGLNRKAHPDTWRDAPGASKWLLLYDNTNTGIFLDGEEVRVLMREALVTVPAQDRPDMVWLVRDSGIVMSVGEVKC